MKKIRILPAAFAVTLLAIPSMVFADILPLPFSDISPSDSAYKAVVKYSGQGIFHGIDGEARLDDVISKEHAALFLLKVLGEENPNMQVAVDRGLLSTVPLSGELLDHATWIKILSNAFRVPVNQLGQPAEEQSWFVAPYAVAQSIMAVKDEKPFDLASRRFFLRTTELYERIFLARTSDEILDEILDEQERRLMKIRDMLIDSRATNNDIEDLIWQNILMAEDMPENPRLLAIKNLNMVSLILWQFRSNPDPRKVEARQKRVEFFVEQANKALPAVEPFSGDLLKIGLRG